MSRRNFILRPMRPKMSFILPTRGTLSRYELEGIIFSFSPSVKRGRLLDMRRMWRLKKPWFWVEKDAWPFRILDDSQATGRTLWLLAGLERPLFMLRPGLDQPPPGTGDGLRERDMGVLVEGVPALRVAQTRLAMGEAEDGREHDAANGVDRGRQAGRVIHLASLHSDRQASTNRSKQDSVPECQRKRGICSRVRDAAKHVPRVQSGAICFAGCIVTGGGCAATWAERNAQVAQMIAGYLHKKCDAEPVKKVMQCIAKQHTDNGGQRGLVGLSRVYLEQVGAVFVYRRRAGRGASPVVRVSRPVAVGARRAGG